MGFCPQSNLGGVNVKITWEKVYEDFKQRHPTLKKQTTYFKPYGYAEIEVWLNSGSRLVYNYDEKRAYFIKRV